MIKRMNKSGDKYNMLTLVALERRRRGGNLWRVKCDCGSEKVISVRDAVSGHTKSCGCMSSRWKSEKHKTHGMSYTPEFRVWCHMLGRCFNKTDSKYNYYGGRGITVCERWLEFPNFFADMGNKPQSHSLDRINTNGNYEPGNCRWATAKTQAQNRRNMKSVVILGKEILAVEAERALNLGYRAMRNRVYMTGCTLQESADHFLRRYPGDRLALAAMLGNGPDEGP